MKLSEVEDLRIRLGGGFWDKINFLEKTSSTNEDLVIAVKNGDKNTQILFAGSQTHGKGRLGRSWVSPNGKQIIFSFTQSLGKSFNNQVGWLSLLAGMAIVHAIREVINIEAGLKWPNDVLIGTKKCAGILVEIVSTPDNEKFAVIGAGINIRNSQEFADIPNITTLEEYVTSINEIDLLESILTHLEAYLKKWKTGLDLRQEYENLSFTIGKRVRVLYPNELELIGDAISINANGELIVKTESGEQVVNAADIEHLRLAQ